MINVSVIITTYKRPINIVKRAIDSVLNQTLKNFELIIINDSPENKNDMKKLESFYLNYNCKILFHNNEVNIGACASRNKGISMVIGNYIAFLDDDDEWVETKLEDMLPLFSNDNIAIVYCNYFVIDKENNMKTVKTRVYKDEDQLDMMFLSNYIGGCSVPIIRKSALKFSGVFDKAFPSSQDSDLFRRILMKYKCAHIDKELVKYYIMEDSITSNVDKQIKGWIMMLEKYSNYYDKIPKIKKRYQNGIIYHLIRKKKFYKAFKIYNAFYKKNDYMRNLYVFFYGIKYLIIGMIKPDR